MQDEKMQVIQGMLKDHIKKHPIDIQLGGLRSAREQREEPMDLMLHVTRPIDENTAYTIVQAKARPTPESSSTVFTYPKLQDFKFLG
jgi:hypothetical protein